MLYPELRLRFVEAVPTAPALASAMGAQEARDTETACHVGKDRWVAIEGDELVLYVASSGAEPARELERQAAYAGRLAAVAGDVVALAGEDAPWAFFRCQGDRLIPIGEVRRDTLQIAEHVLVNDQIYLIGRGSGTDESIAIPELEQPPISAGVGRYDHLEAWRSVAGISRLAGGRHYRSFQEVLAEVLAQAGIAVLAVPGKAPATLVLWFRDRSAGVSVLVVPRATSPLSDLDGLHLADDGGATRVQAALQPLWQFAVDFIDEEQEPVEIRELIENVVCVRTP